MFLLWALLATPALADATYRLAYKVDPNPILRAIAVAAGASKFESDGEIVSIQGSRLKVMGPKLGIIADYSKDEFFLVDHRDKTWEKLTGPQLRKRLTEDISSPMLDLLGRFFPRGGKGGTSVEIRLKEAEGEQPTLDAFRKKYGLSYILPAFESVVSVAPGIEERLEAQTPKSKTYTRMDIAIGGNGRMMSGFVQILDYMEKPLPESTFALPEGYREVASITVAP